MTLDIRKLRTNNSLKKKNVIIIILFIPGWAWAIHCTYIKKCVVDGDVTNYGLFSLTNSV